MTAGVALAGAELAQPTGVERRAFAEPVLAVAVGGGGYVDSSLVRMGGSGVTQEGFLALQSKTRYASVAAGRLGGPRWPMTTPERFHFFPKKEEEEEAAAGEQMFPT